MRLWISFILKRYGFYYPVIIAVLLIFSDTALKESHTALSRIYQSLKSAENFGVISIMPNAWESEAAGIAKAIMMILIPPKR